MKKEEQIASKEKREVLSHKHRNSANPNNGRVARKDNMNLTSKRDIEEIP